MLGRNRVCALRFDVEMLLPVNVGAPFKDVFAPCKRAFRIAQLKMFRRRNQLIFRLRLALVGDDFERLDFRLY
jgi:hypothetical protein